MRGSMAVAGLGVLLVASACSSGEQVQGSQLTPETEVYLEAVAEIEDQFGEAINQVGVVLATTYNVREAIFTAVANAGFPGAAKDSLNRARTLEPPAQFGDDHLRWIDFHFNTVDLIDDLESALEERDLQKLLAVETAMRLSNGSFLSKVSREFCLSASFDIDLCRAGDDLPGGEYGKAAHEILRNYTLASEPLFDFAIDMSPDERALRLNEVQPQIEAILKSTGEALSELDPPDSFSNDHATLLRFFEEQYQTAVAITEANAVRDDAQFNELSDESRANFSRLLDGLSDDFDPIGAPFLEDDQ